MRAVVVLLLVLMLPATAAADANVFFLSVGSGHYRPRSASERQNPKFREFGAIDGAPRSARRIAELLANRGARSGALLVSAEGHLITHDDVTRALEHVLAQAAKSPDAFVVLYYAGHGLSEGVGWNHFSVPGDFAGPIDLSDLPGLSNHALYAGDLADRIEKRGARYMMLLDSCYEGTPAAIHPDVLAPAAEASLLAAFAPVRFLNEFHQPNPVVYSTAPGTVVLTAPDPLNPLGYEIGPLARRALLATRDGAAKSLATFVRSKPPATSR